MTTPQRIDMPEPTIAAKGKGTGGMDYTIIGTTMQAVICEIDQGESIVSQSGGMAWMSGNIAMNTNMSGGLGGLLRRVVSGESLFVAEYSCTNGRGFVSFASDFPGKIVPITLAAGQEVIAQKQAFLCAEKSVTFDIFFQRKLGAGFFGGEGFIMERLKGPGVAFVAFDGEIVEYTLEPGQILKVDTGYVAMIEPTVTMDIEMVRGFKNILFGGEGLFLTTLKGPGRIWLQTMPMMVLANSLAQYLPQAQSTTNSSNIGGNVINSLLNQ
ncbi:MAG: TIGR00266 family protein [Chloroflexales bacterium]|nr:TIGR00266 family protein [Chloroflexales bacterium]